MKKLKIGIMIEAALMLAAVGIILFGSSNSGGIKQFMTETFLPRFLTTSSGEGTEKKYIKWVDFDVCAEAMEKACDLDVASQSENVKLNWIELLAYVGTRYGGDFSRYKEKDLTALADKLKSGETTMEALTKDMKYYSYYLEAYTAVLGGMVGEYEAEIPKEENAKEKVWVKKYGLKAYLPLARYFPYSDYDDFGVSRTYGYKRRHLGHDMMGQVGTPVIAVESGYVEALGWNRYGGWRIGIRSFDGKRYYYYAHLRKNYPYNKELAAGSIVQAGDVIGYLGRTGYSSTENVNNIDTPHLHFGLQLIFDESQKEGTNEIWVDCYEIVRFLYRNRSETAKVADSKEWKRVYNIKDPAVAEFEKNKGNTNIVPHNTDEDTGDSIDGTGQ
ncbi:M23 family metallopeptidase [Anaerocolumna xylanovorans]|uniref:Peptidase family M23 n=1 Tax=Anaerocolumna xylanovorans DSM 12503 TaxID=1121345 RepID=A0A1M7YFS3_9FIRM|nr:M23 family metallopeptidase [Anaerocolumna xylanovorans]SHO51463.1 Peptidase family M23 [Anaerocolumna xylanovorans DSM 12503]